MFIVNFLVITLWQNVEARRLVTQPKVQQLYHQIITDQENRVREMQTTFLNATWRCCPTCTPANPYQETQQKLPKH